MKQQQKGQDIRSERYGRQYGESSLWGVHYGGCEKGACEGVCTEGSVWREDYDTRLMRASTGKATV